MTPQQAADRYHWIKFNKEKATIELYLDHFMLSGLRLCEAKFALEHLLWIKPKYVPNQRKPWFLDFGEYVHFCLEIFYDHFKKHKCPPIVDEWLKQCKDRWEKMKMVEYATSDFKADRDKYEALGGWEGVAGLLIEYYAFYMDLRVRVVDTEITFGHNKEVLIGKFGLNCKTEVLSRLKRLGKPKLTDGYFFVECYLTGRIDLLVDNGYKIGPVDHKTTTKFDGFEHLDFNPQDAITGYILTINNLLKKYRDKGLTNIPVSSGGWIYHISSNRPSQPRDKTKKLGPRFKTTPVDKTIGQLEDFKARNLSTFKRVCDLLFNDKVPEWNTYSCHNIFFRHCEYVAIHEQPSNEWQEIINKHYTVGSPWDTREHSNKDANKISGQNTETNSKSTTSTKAEVLVTIKGTEK